MDTPHRIVNPAELPAAVGFAHAVVAEPGRTVYLGGQIGCDPDGVVRADTLVAQYDLALSNVVTALRAAGGRPGDLVAMTIYTTDLAGYRSSLAGLGQAHRRHLGRHYPATALFGVTGLFEPAALVELVCLAVVPD
ncbi:MAG TPA: RidA family protein [Mycobacteriales bacterium]|jgi:Putative translation initiation inhibitor, yjgF family